MSENGLNTARCGTLPGTENGCLEIFPRFDGVPGDLCMKCKKVGAATSAEEKATLRDTLIKCEGCGLCSTQLEPPKCGACKREDAKGSGLPSAQDTGAAARAELMRKRLGNPNPPGPLQALTNHVMGPTTTVADLEMIRVIDKSIGSHTFSFAMETPLEKVLADAVAHADIGWIADAAHPLSLKIEDCVLRFPGNISIDDQASTLTLKGLYGSLAID
ncbi:hypothetical protein DFH06DRAFT_1330359 [Mycena polygramma]|nr:hypothetical protein DFH06DRAFT_1330359 [Mycena polygramma]